MKIYASYLLLFSLYSDSIKRSAHLELYFCVTQIVCVCLHFVFFFTSIRLFCDAFASSIFQLRCVSLYSMHFISWSNSMDKQIALCFKPSAITTKKNHCVFSLSQSRDVKIQTNAIHFKASHEKKENKMEIPSVFVIVFFVRSFSLSESNYLKFSSRK